MCLRWFAPSLTSNLFNAKMAAQFAGTNFEQVYGKDDPRLGDLISSDVEYGKSQVVIVGFPHDEGVRRNGGRVGAGSGPTSFRKFLPKMGTLVNPEFGIDLRDLKVSDLGDVDQSLSLEEAHKALTEKVVKLIESEAVPFVIGGGNDQSYPNAQALMNAKNLKGSIGVINIDAHLDVRPLKEGKAHSGSPFRQLLDDPLFTQRHGRFIEFASQGHQCSVEHWNFVKSFPRAKIISLSEMRGVSIGNLQHQTKSTQGVCDTFYDLISSHLGENIFVSFDIDSINSDDCPGVSAPGNIGLTSEEACNICFLAGKCPKVKLVDVSEYNPNIEEYRTGRLVVLMFYYFLLGYSQRGEK